jgi:hypothetical protein
MNSIKIEFNLNGMTLYEFKKLKVHPQRDDSYKIQKINRVQPQCNDSMSMNSIKIEFNLNGMTL